MPAFNHTLLLWGLLIAGRARVDPPDQHDAPPPGPLGGHGVPAGQPEEEPHLGPAQAAAAAAAADGRRVAGRAGRGPAACCKTSWAAGWAAARPTTSCCWTTASRCPTAGTTPAPSPRPRRWSSGSPHRPPARSSRRPFTLLAFFARRPVLRRPPSPISLKEPVDADFIGRLRRMLAETEDLARRPPVRCRRWRPSASTSSSRRRAARRLPVSDFRARQWNEPAELREPPGPAQRRGSRDPPDQLRGGGARPTWRSPTCARPRDAGGRRAAVHGSSRGKLRPGRRSATCRCCSSPTTTARPAVKTAEIPPGKTVKERFPVYFPAAGPHRITARLESDAIAADNYRYVRDRFPRRPAGAAGRRRPRGPRRRLSRRRAGPRPAGASPASSRGSRSPAS